METAAPIAASQVPRAGAASALLWRRLGLGAILALAAALRLWHLDHNNYGTDYYSAGVRSMMASWHDFFFNAFDPAGFVSLDKPPVAFWIQVLSVKLFGFGGLAILVPQVVEGLAAVALLYHLVQRRFGAASGLLAALFLALTPIIVAIDRSSNTDSALVLALLLAAWPAIIAVERGEARFLLLALAVIGLGFNIKMLAAFVLVPAVIGVYALAAPLGWRWRLLHVAVSGVVLAAVSLVWVLAYDLTPAEDRPYVGSSRDNSMLELAVGHNGIERFIRRARLRTPTAPATAPAVPGAGDVASASPATTAPDPAAPAAGPRRARDNVPVGPLRLADPHLAAQLLWLLPLAALGLAALRRRAHPPDLWLWLLWIVGCAVVYSLAGGIFHAYYLAPLAPPLSALAGIGVAGLWQGRRFRLLAAGLLATALWQGYLGAGYLGWHPDAGLRAALGSWRVWLYAAMIAATALAAAGLLAAPRRRALALPALALGMAALLATPTAWALSTVLIRGNVGFPIADLGALAGEVDTAAWTARGGAMRAAELQKLVAFLDANRGAERYFLATTNARLAAPIIIATGASVMAMGGFSGSDPILTPAALAERVAAGEIRFVLISPSRDYGAGVDGAASPASALTDWVRGNGSAVDAALWRAPTMAGSAGDVRSRRVAPPELYDLKPEAGLAAVPGS
jgi:4-amino-4-deoxy-L-arabinose transferase-like glycosyltransferase